MGGTKIRGILLDAKGRILTTYERPTEANAARKKILNNILEVITILKSRASNEKILGLGIASPGFALINGKMTCMPNIKKLEGFNLKKELEKKSGLKTWLENDANCFALAEHFHGAAKHCKNSLGLIIGTGVGVGIIINNQIYRGASGGAGEAGHSKLIVNLKNQGSIKAVVEVESLISGPNIVRRYEELSKKKAYSPLIILNKQDEAAKKTYSELVLYTGIFLANLIDIFNPEAIVIGGGVSKLPFYKDLHKVVQEHAHPKLARDCKIKKSELGDDGGAIGAAELVFNSVCSQS